MNRLLVYIAVIGGGLLSTARAVDILSTSGFQTCGNGTQDITVSQFKLSFDRSNNDLTFSVAGNSLKSQNVVAEVTVKALGEVRYTNTFDPCQYNITQLCPIPAGPFHASGNITIPDQYTGQIPSIAFSIPDLDGSATLQLIGADNKTVSCLTSQINNGKSTSSTGVTLATVGIAGAALVMTGIASFGSLGAAAGGTAGPNSGSAHAPNFADIVQWFQFIAYTGMYSVDYPPVYRSFAKNFAWATGLVSWASLQDGIDSFRARTGGNLTDMNYQYLKNATLVYVAEPGSKILSKRDLDFGFGDGGNGTSGEGQSPVVSGIAAFVESLVIPSANTFLTVLVIFLLVLAAVAVAMLAFKVILELWARCGHLSKRWEQIRSEYWRILITTLVRIILVVYGTWALYCLFQFREGDSWAAAILAAGTLAVFTAVLAVFTIRIFYLASKAKKLRGSVDELYEHEPWVKKYGFFYDQYKSRLWWFFVPIIIMSLVRAFLLVFAAGSGLVQAIGILAAEGIFLFVLFWRRPYDGRGANVVNAMIAITRVLSIVCILVFVQELGISRTTQTVLGVVLIAVQSTLTVALAILIAISAITSCMHKRKPSPKFRDLDDDMQPLSIPADENASELQQLSTRKGYMPAATNEQGDFVHRASTVHRDPYIMGGQGSTQIYEEYSSSYGGPTPNYSVASRKPSMGHGSMGSTGHDGEFHYRQIANPPPVEMTPQGYS